MADFDDMRQRGEDYLMHHGIKNQHWGVRNGPPYPLNKEGREKFKKKVKEIREKNKENRRVKRRKKILKDPAKMVKYQDEFTIEELAEAIKKFDMVEEVRKRIPKVEKEQKQQLSLLQKQLASSPAKLAKNADKFNKNDYQLAYDRLKRQRDLQDMTIEDAKRPAKILGVGNAYIGEIASGVGKVKGLTGDIIGTHDNFMLLTGSGKKYGDQYSDRYPGNKPQGLTKKDLEDYLRSQGLIQ